MVKGVIAGAWYQNETSDSVGQISDSTLSAVMSRLTLTTKARKGWLEMLV